jgi:hypothetical protein
MSGQKSEDHSAEHNIRARCKKTMPRLGIDLLDSHQGLPRGKKIVLNFILRLRKFRNRLPRLGKLETGI